MYVEDCARFGVAGVGRRSGAIIKQQRRQEQRSDGRWKLQRFSWLAQVQLIIVASEGASDG
jgi:hypothetical protein